MESQHVNLSRLTDDEVVTALKGSDPGLSRKANEWLKIFLTQGIAVRQFLLEWDGDASLAGVSIEGQVISSTSERDAVVTGNCGCHMIGTFVRLVRNSGEGGRRQRVLLYLIAPGC